MSNNSSPGFPSHDEEGDARKQHRDTDSAEEGRVAAECTRQEAERQRQGLESLRQEGEARRNAAEQLRHTAEASREAAMAAVVATSAAMSANLAQMQFLVDAHQALRKIDGNPAGDDQ